jgi:hypothetical protein
MDTLSVLRPPVTASPTSAVDRNRVGDDDLGMIREQAELLSLALDRLQARGASFLGVALASAPC